MDCIAQTSTISAKVSGSVKVSCRAGLKANVSLGFRKNDLLLKTAARNGSVITMSKSPAADGYAAALVGVGKASGHLDAIHKDIENLAGLISDKELSNFLANPTVDEAKKKQLLQSIAVDSKFSPSTLNFLNLVVDKKRVAIIGDIVSAFEQLYYEETDTQVAVVTSAHKLENAQQALIAKKLQTVTGAKNIKLKNVIDHTLVAGFVVKYGKDGSSEIDMSVKGQLEKLTSQLKELAEKS